MWDLCSSVYTGQRPPCSGWLTPSPMWVPGKNSDHQFGSIALPAKPSQQPRSERWLDPKDMNLLMEAHDIIDK